MLEYFPGIYPNELLYSVLGRFMCHSGILNSTRLPEDVFGSQFRRCKTFLHTHLGRLAANLPLSSCELTAQRLAEETTLLPYLTAYRPQEDRDWALAALIGDDANARDLRNRLGLMPSSVRLPSALRYCPICRVEMLERHGELYWRRDHQLPGVLVCPIHTAPLADSRVVLADTRRHQFIAADEDNCPADPAFPAWADEPDVVRLLQNIAIGSANLLTTPPSARSFEAWREEVCLALRLRGFSPRGNQMNQRALADTFSARFGPILNILPEASRVNWLKAITHAQKRAFAPLHHVLFRLLIESLPIVEANNPSGAGPWPCRNPLAEHYGQSVITNCELHKQNGKSRGVFCCSCGYAFSTASEPGSQAKVLDLGQMFKARLREVVAAGNGLSSTAKALHVTPYTVMRYAALLGLETPWKARCVYAKLPAVPPIDHDAMRAAWTHGHTAAPDLTRRQLRSQIPAVYRWLYAHDRDWLEKHPPADIRNFGRPRLNWSDIDTEKVETLRREAARLRAQIPPQRVTRAALKPALGQTGWLAARMDKLPLCVTALGELTESVEEFQRRRILWAAEELRRREASISVSRLRKLIHLQRGRLPEVESFLKKTAGEI